MSKDPYDEDDFFVPSAEEEVRKFEEARLPTTKKKVEQKSCTFKLPDPSYELYKKLIKELDVTFNKFCIDALRHYAFARLDHIIAAKQKAPQVELEQLMSRLGDNQLLDKNSDAADAFIMLKEALEKKGTEEDSKQSS